MSSLAELEISPRIISALRKRKVSSIAHILVLSREELAAKTQISASEIKELLEAISKKLTPFEPCSALEIWNGTCAPNLQHCKLSLGCPVLDEALRGGLLLPGINEISGESGSGKTQLALQICLTSQLATDSGGLNGGSLFISTEDAFPTKRLNQLSVIFEKKFKMQNMKLMDHIYVEHAADVEDLWSLVKHRIPGLLMNSKVRLIVIDSIAALFRVEYTLNEAIERSKALAEFGQELQKISHKYMVAILCINQISDVVSKDGKGEDIGGRRVVPALGLTWSNLVTTRIMVMRTPYTVSQLSQLHDITKARPKPDNPTLSTTSNLHDSVVRKLKVLFAPHLPNNECHYVVEEDGVRGIRI